MDSDAAAEEVEKHPSRESSAIESDTANQQSPPSLTKFILNALFTACLNWADFASDWYVILQYGCIIDSAMSTGCGQAEELQGCKAHPWWFGIGLFVLIGSNLVQSWAWAGAAINALRDERLMLMPKGDPASFATILLLFILAFFQVHYLLDIALACRLGVPNMKDRRDAQRILGPRYREVANKLLESAPQLYFQAYILFAVGSHGDVMKVLSVIISACSLSHGVMMLLYTSGQNSIALTSLTALWLVSDQVLRSAGYALVLSEAPRPYGIAVIALASLVISGHEAKKDAEIRRGQNAKLSELSLRDWGLLAIGAVVCYPPAFFLSYLVPTSDMIRYRWPTVLVTRWLEMAIFATVAFLVARTPCGQVPTSEVAGLLCLLLSNICIYIVRHFCFEQEIGNPQQFEFGKGDLQQEGGTKDIDTRPSSALQAEPGASSTCSAPLRLADVEVTECSSQTRGDAVEAVIQIEANTAPAAEREVKEVKRRMKRRMVKRKAKRGADGTGASCLDSDTRSAGDAVDAETGTTPLVPGSPKNRKKKTTVPKTKAKKGQSGNGFQEAEATTGDQVRTEKASSEQALLATNFNSVIVRPMVGVDT